MFLKITLRRGYWGGLIRMHIMRSPIFMNKDKWIGQMDGEPNVIVGI